MSTPQVLCPHCHRPADPAAMDTARSPLGTWRICPICEEPLLFLPATQAPAGADPAAATVPVEA